MRLWLSKRVHLSWHIAGCATGIIIGTTAAYWLPFFWTDGLWLLLAALLTVLIARKRWRWLFLGAVLAGMVLGAWRGTNEQKALTNYAPYYARQVRLSGVLRDDMTRGPKGDWRFELQEVRIDTHPPLKGKVWVSTPQDAHAKRGERLVVQGTLQEGFGTTIAALPRATIIAVEHPHPDDMPRVFRDWFARAIRRGIADPEAALGIGYLTGQRTSLPSELDEQLRVVGLTHAVVASGYNLTILVSFARNALAGVSKYTATLSASLLIASFMLIAGLSPSMTRAGLVSGLSLATWYYGRVIHPLVLLPVAAAITVLLRPSYAWGDIGWCLSFAAFAGIIIVSPLLKRYLWARGEDPPALLAILVDTVAAQISTLPIILYAFGQYAAYALLANLLVLPLVPLTMALTFFTGLAGVVLPQLATIAGTPANWILRYMLWVIVQIANWPGAQATVHFNTAALILSYTFLVISCIWLWRKTCTDFRSDNDRQHNV